MSDNLTSVNEICLSDFRCISFDLFGTLAVQIDELLPSIDIEGMEFRSLLAGPLTILAQRYPSIDISEFLTYYFDALAHAKKEICDRNHRELGPEWVFQNSLVNLELSDDLLAMEMATALMSATVQSTKLLPNVLPLLEDLRSRGLSLGLISNLADGDGGRILLQKLELNQHFDTITLSGDFGWRKPNPTIFTETAANLGYPPKSILHIGDEWHADIVGASQAGYRALLISNTLDSQTHPSDFEKGVQFSDFSEFVFMSA